MLERRAGGIAGDIEMVHLVTSLCSDCPTQVQVTLKALMDSEASKALF